MSTFQILFFFVFNALEVFFDFFFCIVFFFRVIAPIWSLRNFASLLCPLSSHLFSFHSKKKRFACKVLSDFLERESVHCADKKSMKRKRLMMEQNSTFIDARPCLKKKKTRQTFGYTVDCDWLTAQTNNMYANCVSWKLDGKIYIHGRSWEIDSILHFKLYTVTQTQWHTHTYSDTHTHSPNSV